MALTAYNKKRDFKQTREPEGKAAKGGKKLVFVIQRHRASHLHYDFRLEMEGVLKSWAIPKGPSLNPADKRLAMMVEDHPFAYRTFEGEIPEGNYGAGMVEIWDEGTYEPLEATSRKEDEASLLQQFEKGSLKFKLNGKKLKGEFALVKMHNGRDENAWLLLKHRDDYAVEQYDAEDYVPAKNKVDIHKKKKPETDKEGHHFKAGRTYHIAENHANGEDNKEEPSPHAKSPKEKTAAKGVKKKLAVKMPQGLSPMLATLTDAPFDNKDWVYEIKLDGYRAIARIENGAVTLQSRNNISFAKYAPVIADLEQVKADCILDGEVVVLDEKGISRFQLLQHYEPEADNTNLIYYVFDILYLDGEDLRNLPLIERKTRLEALLPTNLPHIRYNEHIKEQGIAMFKEAEKSHLEGIIAKNAQSRYLTGKRSQEWLKIKTELRQEAVICGYNPPQGSRKYFGSLVMGLRDGHSWKYIGSCGTGFNEETLKEVYNEMQEVLADKSPFGERIPNQRKVTWLHPQLIAELSFTEWTADEHMRHPVFHGLRIDKDATAVVHEEQVKAKGIRKSIPAKADNEQAKEVVKAVKDMKPKQEKQETEARASRKYHKDEGSNLLKVDGFNVQVSHPDKVYWPEEGYTKGHLIAYYESVAKYMLPYLKGRPQSMHRFPNGIKGSSFFHKDVDEEVPEFAEKKKIWSESNDAYINYLICNNKATLLYMANLGCIEINPWNSTTAKPEKPDWIVMDLDPGTNTFEEVIEVAQVIKEILDQAGITGYPKTSGATGLHIYIPMGARYDYEQGKDFAHIIAQLTHERMPKNTSIERAVKGRKDKIYVDFLQNRGGQTLAAPYSVRPKPGATVSTPLEWSEVKSGLHPSQFTILNTPQRLEKKGDLFKGVLGKGIDLEKVLGRLG